MAAKSTKKSDASVRKEFRSAVNMTRKQLEKWLKTDESTSSGQAKDGGESTGHKSGRRIVTILGKKKDDLTEADEKHMRKVVAYIERHRKQRPDGDVRETTWRYSLMNWGHDPLKK